MSRLSLPYSHMAQRVLDALAKYNCVSIAGLSNTGKSTLMRGLASDEAQKAYRDVSGRKVFLIYVDCNRAVAISSQAFYEVVLRSTLEHLGEILPPAPLADLRSHYQDITDADNSFSASLAFNLGLTDLCEQLDTDVCLLLDEFDEIYSALEDRALLNLRALRDRFCDRLTYVTATVRSLRELRRVEVEGEFAELFSRTSLHMALLDPGEAKALVEDLGLSNLSVEQKEACLSLGGGHPGLLIALAQTLARLHGGSAGDQEAAALQATGPGSECLKIWGQLTSGERAALQTLVLESDEGLPEGQMRHLGRLSLIKGREIFSPIFAEFVARRGRAKEVGAEGVHLDADSGDVWVDGVRIPVLTDLEFRLLQHLFERRDKITDKFRIVSAVWGEEYLGDVDDARVEKLVSRLRSKIEPDPSAPRYLITQRGRGYKLLSQPRTTVH